MRRSIIPTLISEHLINVTKYIGPNNKHSEINFELCSNTDMCYSVSCSKESLIIYLNIYIGHSLFISSIVEIDHESGKVEVTVGDLRGFFYKDPEMVQTIHDHLVDLHPFTPLGYFGHTITTVTDIHKHLAEKSGLWESGQIVTKLYQENKTIKRDVTIGFLKINDVPITNPTQTVNDLLTQVFKITV